MLRLGHRSFADHTLLVMAIVNRTRDSFYDRGATFAEGAALERVREAVAAGADLVDIGGVKAGPGDLVDVDEEIRRTAPFVATEQRTGSTTRNQGIALYPGLAVMARITGCEDCRT